MENKKMQRMLGVIYTLFIGSLIIALITNYSHTESSYDFGYATGQVFASMMDGLWIVAIGYLAFSKIKHIRA